MQIILHCFRKITFKFRYFLYHNDKKFVQRKTYCQLIFNPIIAFSSLIMLLLGVTTISLPNTALKVSEAPFMTRCWLWKSLLPATIPKTLITFTLILYFYDIRKNWKPFDGPNESYFIFRANLENSIPIYKYYFWPH